MEGSQNNLSNDMNKAPTIQFRAQDIGTAKVSQTDFFKKHRQEYATRQEKVRKIRRSITICASVVVALSVVTVVSIIIVRSKLAPVAVNDQVPPEMQIWNGEAQKIQNAAQQVYEEKQDVGEYFEQQISESPTNTEKANMVLVEMQFYTDIFQPEAVIAAASKLDMESLTTSQVGIYGGLLMNAYINIGNDAMAEHYLNLMEEKDAIGGGEG